MEICVIGGGAAGMLAALAAARTLNSGKVVLLERNHTLGRKLSITGKGRGNVTNARTVEEFIQAFGASGRFLYPAFEAFFSEDLSSLLTEAGLSLKVERGGRIFPVTDRAADVVQALCLLLARSHVEIHYDTRVRRLHRDVEKDEWLIQGGDFPRMKARAVILATGGKSYPGTGSTGDGYVLLEELGHHIDPLLPGLVPLRCSGSWLSEVAGTALEGVEVTASAGGRQLDRRYGEVMITDRGLGGPVILSLSLAVVPALARGDVVSLRLDLRPRKTQEQVDRDIADCRDASDLERYLQRFVPQRLAEVLMHHWGLELHAQSLLAQKERRKLASSIKGIEVTCTGADPLSSAIITQGGVLLKEVDPRTMQSRIASGIFIVGELLNLQAVTGGYNLQTAFSTGFLAGKSAAEYVAKTANESKL